jgi:hypothetical protein
MKTFVAVARREIAEKKFILWAALATAVMPFVVPVLRGLGGDHARDVRDLTALILGVGLSAAIAAGVGSSIFAGELAGRKMGFYFGRPISTFVLWAGKLAAGLALVAATLLLVLGPTAVLDRDHIVPRDLPFGPWAVAGGLLGSLLLANFVSTMMRSRSLVAFADLIAALAVGIVVAIIATRLQRWGFIAPRWFEWTAALLVAGALLWSSYRGLARGRTDIRAVHTHLSTALWTAVSALVVAFALYAAWVLATPPSALVGESVTTLGPDGWIFLSGRPRGAHMGILYDTRSSRFERTTSEDVSVSGDGRVAAWVEYEAPQDSWILFTRRLDAAEKRVESRISYSNQPYPLLVSQDGRRVAAVESGLLTVADVATGKTLASVRIGQTAGLRTGWFVTPDRVRVLRQDGAGLISFELDLADRARLESHSNPTLAGMVTAISTRSDRIVVRDPLRNRVAAYDARTLEEIATLLEGLPPSYVWGRFVDDGSLVLSYRDSDNSWLDIFSPSFTRVRRIRLGDRGGTVLGQQPEKGKLYVSYYGDSGVPSPAGLATLYLADIQTGTLAKVAVGLRPLLGGWFWPRTQVAYPGSESSRLFLDEPRGLIRLDPTTGERRQVLAWE